MTEGTGPADSWGVRGTQRPENKEGKAFSREEKCVSNG